jgi:hypothetical protein
VSLDLDDLEREGAEGPFVLKLGGRTWEFRDLRDLDYREVAEITRDPIAFVRLTLPRDDVQKFFELQIPLWKLNKLEDAYLKHFGMPSPGELLALRT